MLAFAIFASDFLKWLLDNSKVPGSQDTAMNWLIAAIVIAAVCTAVMMLYKGVRKSMAAHAEQKIWSRGETLLLIVAGLAPVLVVMSIIWYMTRNFFNIVGVGGLFKGILLGWLLYLVLIFVVHLASPWRRELI